MELYNGIITRRSIRSYREGPIADDVLKKIIKAGCYAPSAVNKQPWEFVVINKRELLDEIPKVHPHSKMLLKSEQAILVCGDVTKAHSIEYMMLDLSAATQNILLAAHSEGIGACWLGIYPREERMELFYDMLDLPADIMPFALISLGYSDEKREVPERFREELIHINRW